jgi:predicted alpha/beta hydrolase family esterase
MKDPYVAKKEIWLSQMKNEFECDENTLLIGHSSGAEAAMRYAEDNKVM